MKIIDMHCDTIERLYFLNKKNKTEGETKEKETLRENSGHLDLLRMQENNYYLQNFALFVDRALWPDPWQGVEILWKLYQQELQTNQDIICQIRTYEDVVNGDGRLKSMLTVEEGGVCQGSVRKLHKLYRMNVRMMTLTWNYRNELGTPATPIVDTSEAGRVGKMTPVAQKKLEVGEGAKNGKNHSGLTEKGREFVEEMQHIGMIVDVSHLSDDGFWNVVETSRKPFVASHSNARAICPHGRNLTDEMIKKIGETGGCIGLNYHLDFLLPHSCEERDGGIRTGETCNYIWEMVAAHARHIVQKGGIEVLGLGSDFDGIPTNIAIPGVEGVQKLWWKLKERGFTEGELDKIMYKNVLKVYKECL